MNTPTLRRGDIGADVTTLQQRLNRAGVAVAIDGHFGPATETAVRAFQSDHGMIADGIAGARTQAALLGHGVDPKALTEADIQHAAQALGCDTGALHAILEVEAPRGGFLPDGRVTILFERHIFYRQLREADIDALTLAQRQPTICNTAPGGYVGGAAEYQRLALAKAINVDCALASASWGRMQVMGFHWKTLGYPSVAAFVENMATGEAEQLRAGVKLIAANEAMHAALVAHDWPAFAQAYNGPAYAGHGYDLRLAAAYRRYPAAQPAAAPTTPEAEQVAAAVSATDAEQLDTENDVDTSRRGKHKAKPADAEVSA